MPHQPVWQPKGLRPWPTSAVDLDTPKLVELYRAGFAGATFSPDEYAAFESSIVSAGGLATSEAVIAAAGAAGDGAGKLTLLHPYVLKCYGPDVWPFPAQRTGDCVGVAGAGVALVLLCVEACLAKPDEVTGRIEQAPEVSATGRANGVIAWEAIYGDRGHGGQGASCDRLAQHLTKWGGMLLRQPYPDLQLDLTTYQVATEVGWGRSGTPEAVRAVARQHQVRHATVVNGGHEHVRDTLANGWPGWICSGLGFSPKRDENGVSHRQGSWAHSWIVTGYDDRPETKRRYGCPLALAGHRWGKWNSGGKRILGTDLEIFDGWWWFDARLLDSCHVIAVAGADGWKRRSLPDYGVKGFG